MTNPQINIAVFASGAGTNAENLIRFFDASERAEVSLVCCNNPSANVVNIARAQKVECLIVSKSNWESGNEINQILQSRHIDFIVLAGFLWKIPPSVIEKFPNKIINIHPSLLPKFGGKGMYGHHVHNAVIEAQEKKSGISIHLVNEEFDKGKILFQAEVQISENESAETLARKINALELQHFPSVVANYIEKQTI